MPVPSDLRVDAALSGFSQRYSNAEYIADRAFPTMRGTEFTSKDGGKYYTYNKDNLRIENDGPLGTRAPARSTDWGGSYTSFLLGRYALKELVTQDEMDNAEDVQDPEEDTTAHLTDLLLVAREKRAADKLFSTTNLTNNTTLSGSQQWSDETSTPLKDFETGAATMWREPNAVIMGMDVWRQVRHHPDIVQRFQYVVGGGVTRAQFAQLLDIPAENFMIGSAKYNNAVQGQSDVAANIWGKGVVLAYIDPSPRPRAMTATATLERGNSREVTEWSNDDPEGTWKKVQDRYLHQIIATDLAYYIAAAVA